MTLSGKRPFHELFLHPGNGGADAFVSTMHHTVEEIGRLFAHSKSPYSGKDPDTLHRSIRQTIEQRCSPLPVKAAIDLAVETIAQHSVFVHHPHCLAHLHTPPMIPALAAEALLTAWNPSMDSWDQAPAATYVEIEVIRWLNRVFGFGEGGAGTFTGGGTQSNFMGLLLARDHACAKATGHDVRRDGLPNYANRLRIVTSETTHFSIVKAASQLGLGERSVALVSTDPSGRIDMASLARRLSDLRRDNLIPMAIVGTLGTTDQGALDDVAAIADLAAQYDVWLHLDAAYGGALILTAERSKLIGIERADSLAVDFHKFFYQPISCGAFLLRDRANFSYLEHHADYLNRETDTLPNLSDHSIATSRRFDALKLWLTLQCVSDEMFAAMFEHVLKLTRLGGALIREEPRLELLQEPQLSTLLFRVRTVGGEPATSPASAEFQRRLRLRLLLTGKAILGETVVRGVTCLKWTLLNPCLLAEDLRSLLTIILQEADRLMAEMASTQLPDRGRRENLL